MLCFPYISHDSTALCYTEGATQKNTNYGLPTEQRCGCLGNSIITVPISPECKSVATNGVDDKLGNGE